VSVWYTCVFMSQAVHSRGYYVFPVFYCPIVLMFCANKATKRASPLRHEVAVASYEHTQFFEIKCYVMSKLVPNINVQNV